MGESPYSESSEDQLILRDLLAADRTALANERTLLAYIRTALAFFVTGVAILHFVTAPWTRIIGWLFVPAGAIIFVIGWVRFVRIRGAIRRIKTGSAPRATG